MSDLRDLLHGAASSPAAALDFDALLRGVTRRRRRRQVAVAAATVVAVVVPIWLVTSMRDTSEPTDPITTSPTTIEATVPTTEAPVATSTTEVSTSTSTVPEPPAGFRTLSFAVVDENGEPHDEAVGVGLCDITDEANCAWPGLDDLDGDGIVSVTVDLEVVYRVQAFVRNAGWPGAYVGPGGAEYFFSRKISGRGDEFVDGTQLVIPVPVPVDVVVLDGVGSPLPPGVGAVMVCPADGTGACSGDQSEYRVVDDDDGDGTVVLGLERGVVYVATAVARDSGWCSPGMIAPDGVAWHFGDNAVAGAAELDGRELRVVDPCG